MNVDVRQYLRINPISVHELTLSENSTDCFLYFPYTDNNEGYTVYTQKRMFWSIVKDIFGSLVTGNEDDFQFDVTNDNPLIWNDTDIDLNTDQFKIYQRRSVWERFKAGIEHDISDLKTAIGNKIRELKDSALLDYDGAVEIQTRFSSLYDNGPNGNGFEKSKGQIWCFQDGVSFTGLDEITIGNNPLQHKHKDTKAETTTQSFTSPEGGGQLVGKFTVGNKNLVAFGDGFNLLGNTTLDMVSGDSGDLTHPLYGQNILDWRTQKQTHNNVPPCTNVWVKYKEKPSTSDGRGIDGYEPSQSPRDASDADATQPISYAEALYESSLVPDLETYTESNLSEHDYLLRMTLDDKQEDVVLRKQIVKHLLGIFSEKTWRDLSITVGEHTYPMEDILRVKLDKLLIPKSEFIQWYNGIVKQLNEIRDLLEELKRLQISIKPRTYLGRVIISTTDDTEQKVIRHYGGRRWRRIVNFLRGSDTVANVIGRKWGEEYVCLRESNIPLHTHQVQTNGIEDDEKKSWMAVGKSGNTTNVVNIANETDTNNHVANRKINYQISPLEYGAKDTPAYPHDNMPPYREVYIWECTEVGDSEEDDNRLVTVKFVSNGVVVEIRKYPIGVDIGQLPENPEQTGYRFKGWFTDAGTEINPQTDVPSDDVTYYAHWEPITVSNYIVTFNPNSGSIVSGPSRIELPPNSILTEFPEVNRDGYEFQGWYTSDGRRISIGQEITGNVTYYAHWSGEIEYKIAWILNGHGTTLPGNVKYTYKYSDPEDYTPEDISADGYEFQGWNPKSIPKKSTGDKTFRARWKAPSRTIRLHRNYYTEDDTIIKTMPIEYGNRVSDVPQVLERSGYEFGGWFSNRDGTGNELYEGMKYMASGNSDYYAKWTAMGYRVILDKQGGTGGDSEVFVTCGQPMPPITPPTYANKVFEGYWEDTAGTGNCYYNETGTGQRTWEDPSGGTIYAKWNSRKYKATFNANGGKFPDNTTSKEYQLDYGAAITAPSNPTNTTGEPFSSWNPPVPATMPPRNVTFNAQWGVITYTLVFDANGGVGGWSGKCAEGATVPVPTVTRLGYNLNGWNPAITGKTVTATEDKTWRAIWDIIYYGITYNMNGHGSVPDKDSYTVEEEYTPPERTATGYTFKGWDPEKIAVGSTGEKTFAASWEANKYQVSFNANGGTGTMSNQPFTYDVQQALTENAFNRTGYMYQGWATSSGGSKVYDDKQSVKNLTATANGTFNLYAVWQIIQYTIYFNPKDGTFTDGGNGIFNRNYGDAMPNPAVARTGYTFTGWTPHRPETVPDQNCTFEAVWASIAYNISYVLNGGSYGTYHPSSANYDQTFSVSSPSKTGYTFQHWTGTNLASGAQYGNTPDKPSVLVPCSNNQQCIPNNDGIVYFRNLQSTQGATVTLTANWLANTYYVRFNANGGTGSMANQTFTYDSGQNLTANAYGRTGYTYQGWATSSSGAKAYDNRQWVSNLTATANGTFDLYAVWQVNQYTATFDANGGSGGTTKTQNYGTPLSAPTVTRDGYTFDYWSPSVPSTMPAENKTYTAQWKVIQYTVTFNANGGTVSPTTRTVNHGAAVGELPTPTYTGHTFNGWFTESTGGSQISASTTITYDVIYYAHWTSETPPTPTEKTFTWDGTDQELKIGSVAAGGFGDHKKVFSGITYYGVNTNTAVYTLEADFVYMRHWGNGGEGDDGSHTNHLCYIGAQGVRTGETPSVPTVSTWHINFCEITASDGIVSNSYEFTNKTGPIADSSPTLEGFYNFNTTPPTLRAYRIAVNFTSTSTNQPSFHVKCTFDLAEPFNSMNVGDKFDIYFYLSKDHSHSDCGGYRMTVENAKLTCVTSNA